ncbi:mitochondrial fission regulator 2-like [Xenia sp. Carnegie-2017]|uniref:mitochondrial fission regulator 2-like n=1 Tax=Xenia sp. Carnegie-2017 TaxID=2897299 RepID=UPI001F040527|nr:mitochondrial fission regulator 2-like [Xenia sp. Carnegie-2017]
MEPEGDLNIREEILHILNHLSEILRRLWQTDEGETIFMRWKPLFLRKNGEKKSVLRYVSNKLPAAIFFAFDPLWSYSRSIRAHMMTRKSFIRKIATRLPLQPSKRPYFYMLHQAGVGQHGMNLKSERFIHSTPCRNTLITPDCDVWDSMVDDHEDTRHVSFAISNDTVQKITALEDELSRLRAQIAGFVLKQDANDVPGNMAPPPPLPPPPPPAPTSTSIVATPQKNTVEKISDNRKNKDKGVLNMATILKDLNQVKLKAVERSPGGTPIRRAPLKVKKSDPASIIADALKNKFAKSRMATYSPDKENQNMNSPGNSFNNTPSPQPLFKKPLSNKPNQRNLSLDEVNSIPMRV